MELMNAAPASLRSAGPVSGLHVLALNSGSSSLKFGLYEAGLSGVETLMSREVGSAQGRFDCIDEGRGTAVTTLPSAPVRTQSPLETIISIGNMLANAKAPAPSAIGHRIVHGGPSLRRHCRIDEEVLRRLEAATAFAPLHILTALALIRAAQERFPGLPQIACFDTTFHAGMPDVARVLPIANELQAEGVQRYGFHGLSCESILQQLGGDLPERLIVAHLGNGASVTAVRAGNSIDTSMGLTPTGGVMMGARSGDLDPGVMVYLMREKNLDAAAIEDMVDRRSGMLGIAGLNGDMRRLRRAAPSNADARLAIEMFCYSVRKQIAAMAAALGGVDLIVFTGGIGENDGETRAEICGGLSWMSLCIEDTRNLTALNPNSHPPSRCAVRVLRSGEDQQIARHAAKLLGTTLCEPTPGEKADPRHPKAP